MKGAGTYPYKRRVSDKKMKNSELKEYLNSFPDYGYGTASVSTGNWETGKSG